MRAEVYMHALGFIYDFVIDIDCASGHYQFVTPVPKVSPALPASGEYDLIHRRMTQLSSHSTRNAYVQSFDFQNMLQTFAQGRPSIELDFGWETPQGVDWKQGMAFPCDVESGSQHILLCVTDVTAEREKDFLRKKEQDDYLFALKSLYRAAYRVDLDNFVFSTVHSSDENDPFYVPPNAFDECFQRRAEVNVSPEHAGMFLDVYNRQTFRQCCERDETLELEYQRRDAPGAPYTWIAATLRPVPAQNALFIFLRDISRIKEAENRFFAALKRSHASIFIIDLYGGGLKVVSGTNTLSLSSPEASALSSGIREESVNQVHPDDLEAVHTFYDRVNLRRTLDENTKCSLEYRATTGDGVYRWYEALALPMPGKNTGEILVLCQDVHARKQMEALKRRMEQRYNAVFRQACDVLLEVDLNTGHYTQTLFVDMWYNSGSSQDYSEFLDDLCTLLHPDDVFMTRAKRTLAVLREAFGVRQDDLLCQYRISESHECHWIESRVVFLDGEEPTAFILIRDITHLKKQEAAQQQEAERLTLALRDTYTEIYELSTETGLARQFFSNTQGVALQDMGAPFDFYMFLKQNVHPDDRSHMEDTFGSACLQKAIQENASKFSNLSPLSGFSELSEEFRRIDAEGASHWVSAIAMPLREGNAYSSSVLIFFRDISQRKIQEEQRRVLEQYGLALRTIYDLFFECNLTRNSYRIHHHGGKYVFPSEVGVFSTFVDTDSLGFIHGDDQPRFRAFFDTKNMRAAQNGRRNHRMAEFRMLHAGGTFRWTSYTVFPVVAESAGEETYLVFAIDIHAHKTAEDVARRNALLEHLRAVDERYRIVVDETNTYIFEWRRHDNSHYVSPEIFERFAGNYDERDILHVWREDGVIHKDDAAQLFKLAQDTRNRREMTVRLRLREGGFLWCRISVTDICDECGVVQHRIGTLNDVDEVTRTALSLRERAELDPLTGIRNMHTFYAEAERLMRENAQRRYATIRLDVDGFKVINDLYGMDEGDKLLRSIARHLEEHMSPRSVCGRISGDVFCACVDFDSAEILHFIHSMTRALSLYSLPIRVTASYGICLVENAYTPINLLCDRANLALKTVKGNAVISYAFYDDTLRESILYDKKVATEMHEALLRGEFELYLQPKVYIPTGAIVGAEGLVRWMHPTEGLIKPDNFVPLFEKNGFIVPLDEYMWEQACKVLRRWLNDNRVPVPLSVNVSRMHAHDPHFFSKVTGLVQRYDLPPQLLELELTESIFLDSKDHMISVVNQLREHGFRFALDDFGAGYSSLNMLKNLPVEVLKIDRGFLDEVVTTEKGKTIIRGMISLAKAIDIQVVAEGVESTEQARFLCQTGCTVAQGFLYAPPVPVSEFEAMLFNGQCFAGLRPTVGAHTKRPS